MMYIATYMLKSIMLIIWVLFTFNILINVYLDAEYKILFLILDYSLKIFSLWTKNNVLDYIMSLFRMKRCTAMSPARCKTKPNIYFRINFKHMFILPRENILHTKNIKNIIEILKRNEFKNNLGRNIALYRHQTSFLIEELKIIKIWKKTFWMILISIRYIAFEISNHGFGQK